MKNFNQYKFHCSQLGKLMTNPRKKTETLSETTKTFLKEIWIKEKYGREKFVSTPAMSKGTMVESDSLDLVQKVTGKTYFKNNKQISNTFVIGTPDVTMPLIDIKSSWDLWTFADVTEDKGYKDYYWQLLGYAWILRRTVAKLYYCLVNTPEDLIQHELFKIAYSIPESEAEEKYRKNYEFGDIPVNDRIKMYRFAIKGEDIKKLKVRIHESRKYLNKLSLDTKV